MEKTVEEYKQQFYPETKELIVRICWCCEKGSSSFNCVDNYYLAQARFDAALDVSTGKLLENKGFNWLDWLVPKKKNLLSFQHGFRFKEGHIYRILVRQYIPQKDDKFQKYYVEQILEKNVTEPRLDAANQFISQFESKETELTVLVKEEINGLVIMSKFRKPVVTFLASINHETNELCEEYGRLTWLENKVNGSLKFKLKALASYHVRVRKSTDNYNTYLLVDVINRVKDDRLERVKEKYLMPVVINDALGKFELNRDNDHFEGKIDYLGEMSQVYLEVEQGEITADAQLSKLREITNNLANWDKRVKEYAAGELLALANDWCEEKTEITKEQFMQRLGVPDITIYEEGKVTFMFDSDEMFTDHGIEIDIDESGAFCGADIVG